MNSKWTDLLLFDSFIFLTYKISNWNINFVSFKCQMLLFFTFCIY